MTNYRDALAAAVGGEANFASWFRWRTMSCAKKRAASELDSAASEMAKLEQNARAVVGATEDEITQILNRYVKLWQAYQSAGSRTSNWMVTGPARFNVARNEKRNTIERRRGEELSHFTQTAVDRLETRHRRAANRTEQIAANADKAITENEIMGNRVVENGPLNRIQIFFAEKPSDEMRSRLKKRGFRWSPSQGAWQRHLNNAGRYAVNEVLGGAA